MSFRLLSPEHDFSITRVRQLLAHWPVSSNTTEVVAIQSPNSVAFVIGLLALWSQQKTVLPLDPKIPAADIQAFLQAQALAPPETPDTLKAALKTVRHQAAGAPARGAAKDQTTPPAPDQLMPLEHAASLIRTSGSSAQPKLAQHSWGNHVYSARGSLQHIPLSPTDRWLLSLPLFHVGGLAIVVRCWLAGATLAIPDAQQTLAEAILSFEPTHLSLVPTQLQRLLDHPETGRALQKCKAILLGGAPVSAELIKKAQRARLNIHTSYGSTEMSSQITTTPPGYWLQHLPPPVLSGERLPHRELRIQEGEIQVRGKTLFQGYREPGHLYLPLRAGWFSTGDLGHWHEGQLQITGRKDYQFISGGENIQPEEIERHLLSLSEIQQAMVVPVSDPEFGARPVAFLRLPQNLDALSFFKTLPATLSLHLPKFKIPLVFYPWPESLHTEGLKPRRKDFQAYAQQLSVSQSSQSSQ
jgi:o-succinylbenzoate---CoA ligase